MHVRVQGDEACSPSNSRIAKYKMYKWNEIPFNVEEYYTIERSTM